MPPPYITSARPNPQRALSAASSCRVKALKALEKRQKPHLLLIDPLLAAL